jgi:hypothetical protein
VEQLGASNPVSHIAQRNTLRFALLRSAPLRYASLSFAPLGESTESWVQSNGYAEQRLLWDLQQRRRVLRNIIAFLWFQDQNTAWLFVPALMLIVGMVQLFRSHIGAPSVWGNVHFLVDELSKQVFGSLEDPIHYHRVTVYKRKKRITLWNHLGPPRHWYFLGIDRSDWLISGPTLGPYHHALDFRLLGSR